MSEVENACIEGRHSKAWQVIAIMSGRKRKQPSGVTADTPEELTQIWEAHFRKLLSPEIPICEVPCYDPVVPTDILFRTDPFDEEELSEAIQSLKSNKDSGLDGMQAEILRIPDL